MKYLIAACLLSWTATAAQADAAVEASIAGTNIHLPVPAGFADPTAQAPILRSRAEQVMPPPVRLLATYAEDSDLQAVVRGTRPVFRRYFMISVLRSTEPAALDIEAFRAVKLDVARHHQRSFDHVAPEVRKHVESAARKIGADAGIPDLKLKMGEARSLGIFNETDTSISTLAVTRVAASSGTEELSSLMGQATSLVLLKSRVLFFTAYARIDGEEDFLWLREQSHYWIASALESNAK